MKIVTLPCSFDNYGYLIVCEETGEAAIVDPAEYYPISCEIESSGVQLRAVYCTHHHADHIGGLEELLTEFPGLKVYGHESDKRRIAGLNTPLADGDKVSVGNIEGQVIHTPGHTAGSVCYQFGNNVFTGDTLFGAGCGRLFEGSPAQMYVALNKKIAAMAPGTNLYFGHEYTVHNLKFAQFVDPHNETLRQRVEEVAALRGQGRFTTPSTVAAERATNPFLRCEEQGVVKTIAEKCVAESLDPVSVFTTLRRLRDSF